MGKGKGIHLVIEVSIVFVTFYLMHLYGYLIDYVEFFFTETSQVVMYGSIVAISFEI